MDAGATRIVIAGGGTGGHLFPALAVADELRRRHPAAEIVFVGARRGLETTLVPATGYRLWTLPLSGLKGTGPVRRVAGGGAAAWAVVRCMVWLSRQRPRLVIGVGGYASGPAVLAARVLRFRTMVMEQNHFPGATNRYLAPRVDAVCVPSEAARERLGGVGTVTGTPVRREFAGVADAGHATPASLLVFGGSRGAHSINRAMTDALPPLASMDEPPRIVHQTGREDLESVADAYRDYPAGRYEVCDFIHDMPERLAAAQLVVCRAGASTLAELAAAGRPAVLVPYPFAADDHQRVNAEEVKRHGAALVLLDREITGLRLAGAIRELLDDPERLITMGRAARQLARPDAAQRIADVADGLLRGADVS